MGGWDIGWYKGGRHMRGRGGWGHGAGKGGEVMSYRRAWGGAALQESVGGAELQERVLSCRRGRRGAEL